MCIPYWNSEKWNNFSEKLDSHLIKFYKMDIKNKKLMNLVID